MTKTRLTFASLLVILGVLAIAATPALAREEHVYSAVFGREVNKTKVQQREKEETEKGSSVVTEAEEDLCTVASGDECQPASRAKGKASSMNRQMSP